MNSPEKVKVELDSCEKNQNKQEYKEIIQTVEKTSKLIQDCILPKPDNYSEIYSVKKGSNTQEILKYYITNSTGENLYCYKDFFSDSFNYDYNDIELKKEDFIFNNISKPIYIGDNIYYEACIGNKKGYIKLGKENEAEKKCIFKDIGNIKEINGKYFYTGILENGNRGYIELGKENKANDKCIFKGIGNILEYKGKIYHIAILESGKQGYIEMGKENNAHKKCIFDTILLLDTYYGGGHYKGILGKKEIYLYLGNDNLNIFFQKTCNLLLDNILQKSPNSK